MEKKKLAIVIPAYKINFFDKVLQSLDKQTNKEFNVYVGIDASKSDFESIIKKYQETIHITYKRFEENLGGKDLVGQWNRCLSLTQNEEWIWLFSDDDMIETNCVENFYQQLKTDDSFDLYHFNVNIINENDNLIEITPEYPDIIKSTTFLKQKCSAKIDSYVVEYIFRKSTYIKVGGFQKFDLAWGSDISTWAKIGQEKGIKTIKGSRVLWRKSSLNITPAKDNEILIRKISAYIQFFLWCKSYFPEINIYNIYYYMFRSIFHYAPYLKSQNLDSIISPLYNYNLLGKLIKHTIIMAFPLLQILHHIIHKYK